MLLTSSLCALALLGAQAPTPGTLNVGGQSVPLRLTQSVPTPFPAELLDWKGLGYLGEQKGAVATPYARVSDWSGVAKQFPGIKLDGASVWRSRIVVFTRAETLGKDPNGLLILNRRALTETQTQDVLEAIARATALIDTKYGGQIDFRPDVSVESEPARDASDQGFGPAFAEAYFSTRINGGAYDAEDKVFRGPFNSAFYVMPGYPASTPGHAVVNWTPVDRIGTGATWVGANPSATGVWQFDPGVVEAQILAAFDAQVGERLRQQGILPGGAPSPAAATLAASVSEPDPAAYVDRLAAKASASLVVNPEFSFPLAHSWYANGMEAALADDPNAGKVLKVTEKSVDRGGAIALPVRTDQAPIADLEKTPVLTFQARSTSKDPITVRLYDEAGHSVWVSLGADPLTASAPDPATAEAPFDHSGQWQTIAVDLRPFAKAAGLTAVTGMSIEPSPHALVADAMELGIAEYFFNDFKFAAEGAKALLTFPAPSMTDPNPVARALAASQATASSPELIAMLKDDSTVVRLNAAEAFTRIKDPTAESALIVTADDFANAIQERILTALSQLGTDPAMTKIRQVLRLSLNEPGRAMSARLLGKTGENKYSGDILLLFTSRESATKVAALDAMSNIKSVESKFRIGFLRNEDPLVRYHVIELTDMKSADYLGAISWHAVNDPSDLVRAEAYRKLIESGDPKYVQEGLKGVKDDSTYVRHLVLVYLAEHPIAAARPALLQAVADRSATVRADALMGFAALPGEVKLEEVANVLADKSPTVLIALARLAKAKNLKLPQTTLDTMKASPVPEVVAAGS